MQVHANTIIGITGIIAIATTGHRSGMGVFGVGRQLLASCSAYLLLLGFAGLPVESNAVSAIAAACVGFGILGFGLLAVSGLARRTGRVGASPAGHALEQQPRTEG